MEFEGKSAVVTGASSGVGAAVVKMLVARGAKVLAVGRSKDKLSALAGALRAAVVSHVADVSEQAQAEAMIAAAVSRFGGIDILINNAGTGGALARVGELDPAVWRRVMATNLDSVYWASRVALPHLIARRGCIVNTASLAGLGADYAMTTYNVSKDAVIALTRRMAIDYAAEGVRVNCISPGFVYTGVNRNSPQFLNDAYIGCTPMGRAGTTEEIAEAMLFLAGPRASYVSGHNLIVDGGTMAHTGLPNVPALFGAAGIKL